MGLLEALETLEYSLVILMTPFSTGLSSTTFTHQLPTSFS